MAISRRASGTQKMIIGLQQAFSNLLLTVETLPHGMVILGGQEHLTAMIGTQMSFGGKYRLIGQMMKRKAIGGMPLLGLRTGDLVPVCSLLCWMIYYTTQSTHYSLSKLILPTYHALS